MLPVRMCSSPVPVEATGLPVADVLELCIVQRPQACTIHARAVLCCMCTGDVIVFFFVVRVLNVPRV